MPVVEGDRVLLRLPGAPGCTMGARPAAVLVCWANAVTQLRKTTTAQATNRTQSAMRYYTTWPLAGSNPRPGRLLLKIGGVRRDSAGAGIAAHRSDLAVRPRAPSSLPLSMDRQPGPSWHTGTCASQHTR